MNIKYIVRNWCYGAYSGLVQEFYILDRYPTFEYTREGNNILGLDSPFFTSYRRDPGTRNAFAGRKMTYVMKDGEVVEFIGDWWDSLTPMSERLCGTQDNVAQAGIGSEEELSKCFVFTGCYAVRSELSRMIEQFSGLVIDHTLAEIHFRRNDNIPEGYKLLSTYDKGVVKSRWNNGPDMIGQKIPAGFQTTYIDQKYPIRVLKRHGFTLKKVDWDTQFIYTGGKSPDMDAVNEELYRTLGCMLWDKKLETAPALMALANNTEN